MWLLMYDVHVVYVDVLLSSACCWYDTDVMCCVCLQWFQDVEESHPQQILLLMYALRRRTCAVDTMLMLCCVCVSAAVSRHGVKSSAADTAADVCITASNSCCCCWYDADVMCCVCLQRFQDVEESHLQQMRLFVDAYMTTWTSCCTALTEVCPALPCLHCLIVSLMLPAG